MERRQVVDQVEAVPPSEVEIDDGGIGPEPLDQVERLPRRRRLAAKDEFLGSRLQGKRHAEPDDRMVVDDQDAAGGGGRGLGHRGNDDRIPSPRQERAGTDRPSNHLGSKRAPNNFAPPQPPA